ncbi:hypothetical protein LIER_21133 [Lithospermum erythrorhizon]|uniref:Uncharacterized protein n=1 Tax=Lithospermum erythrorhizon TaxID=34254 RepID=A0AAV3QP71_LITER
MISKNPKRKTTLAWNLFRGGPQELAQKFERIFRRWVREEVESAISSSLIPLHEQIGSSGSSAWQLRFDNNIPDMLFTSSKVDSLDNRPVNITLYDANSNQIVASGPLSAVKITIVVVDGDFNPDDQEDWTEQDFTNNSSWVRGRKFRLGAKVQTVSNGIRVREGKHYPPYANDDVWRLEKIAKDGALHQRLPLNGIKTVQRALALVSHGSRLPEECKKTIFRCYFRNSYNFRSFENVRLPL